MLISQLLDSFLKSLKAIMMEILLARVLILSTILTLDNRVLAEIERMIFHISLCNPFVAVVGTNLLKHFTVLEMQKCLMIVPFEGAAIIKGALKNQSFQLKLYDSVDDCSEVNYLFIVASDWAKVIVVGYAISTKNIVAVRTFYGIENYRKANLAVEID
jgi:hypothetical protein